MQRLLDAYDVEQQQRAAVAAARCDMLAKLGLMQGAPAAGGVQVGELCAAAVVLVEGTTDEADSLLELMAEESSQSRILDAVLAAATAAATAGVAAAAAAVDACAATIGARAGCTRCGAHAVGVLAPLR
mmetsp:Transcript_34528/g.82267  ORF Transcript_34528/g.82267 Transcript_34528/m.82267 type:complete len:129 (+) Transcript_34528:1259-1645(+)